MKYDKIQLVGSNTVDLPIVGADPSGPYILKAADGLGPTDRDSNIADTAEEGGIRLGPRAHNRQIVFRVGLQPDWDSGQTAADLRRVLHGLLAPRYGLPVVAKFMLAGVVVAQCQGDLSKFEVAIFAKDPEVQITMDCDSPYLVAPSIVYTLPTRTVTGGRTILEINNPGDAPSGFWLSAKFQETLNAPFILVENDINGKFVAVNNQNWAVGDTITIDTRKGSRGVWRTNGATGSVTSQLANLAITSVWLQLWGGVNQLIFPVDTFDWVGNGFGFLPTYQGV